MKVYDVVRKKQYDMAKKNKIYKDAGRRHEIQYKPGDLVLFWDPYRSDVHDVVQKYRFKWSGPHTIIEKISDIHYSVHEGEVIINFDDVTSQHKNCFTANVNRLHPVRYWSEAMPTTEPPYYGMIDDEHYALPDKNYKVTKNKMFIVELTPTPDAPLPFQVAKVLKRQTSGHLIFHWHCNDYNDVFGRQLPGWFNKKDKTVYWREKPAHPSHKPYDSELTKTVFHENAAYTPGFRLLPDDTIPKAVLLFLHKSVHIPWTLPLSASIDDLRKVKHKKPKKRKRNRDNDPVIAKKRKKTSATKAPRSDKPPVREVSSRVLRARLH
jgi:hypothetical protein